MPSLQFTNSPTFARTVKLQSPGGFTRPLRTQPALLLAIVTPLVKFHRSETFLVHPRSRLLSGGSTTMVILKFLGLQSMALLLTASSLSIQPELTREETLTEMLEEREFRRVTQRSWELRLMSDPNPCRHFFVFQLLFRLEPTVPSFQRQTVFNLINVALS